MKTVRFSKVVEKCGKPEVYLLMTETDPDFQTALHADKIMSLRTTLTALVLSTERLAMTKSAKDNSCSFPRHSNPSRR